MNKRYFDLHEYRDGYRRFNPNWEDEDLMPDYDNYLDECEHYDEALAIDLELAAALADGRVIFREASPQ